MIKLQLIRPVDARSCAGQIHTRITGEITKKKQQLNLESFREALKRGKGEEGGIVV